MQYLSLPPTDGSIAGHVKERILGHMYEEREGYLASAKKCGVSTQRAHAELKADKDFADHVAQAREGIAEHLAEELIEISDTADPVNSASVAVRIKTRQWVIEKVLPRFRKVDTNVNVLNDNRVQAVVLDDKTKKELREKLARLTEDTNDITN